MQEEPHIPKCASKIYFGLVVRMIRQRLPPGFTVTMDDNGLREISGTIDQACLASAIPSTAPIERTSLEVRVGAFGVSQYCACCLGGPETAAHLGHT